MNKTAEQVQFEHSVLEILEHGLQTKSPTSEFYWSGNFLVCVISGNRLPRSVFSEFNRLCYSRASYDVMLGRGGLIVQFFLGGR